MCLKHSLSLPYLRSTLFLDPGGDPQTSNCRVPLLCFGKRTEKGGAPHCTGILDIAVTLAIWSGIIFPNGLNGQSIFEVLEQ